MHAQPKKRIVEENVGDCGIGPGLAAAIANGEDVGPIVRHVFEFGKPEAILHHLRNIVKKKEAEIEDACKLHYEEFILAVDELQGVLADADNLRTQVMLQEARLQEAIIRILAPVDEFIELEAVKRNVGDAINALKACVRVTSLCHSCNLDVSRGRFYPALNTLDLIEKNYLHSIPVKTLQQVISKQLPAIKLHIENKVCGEFNDWLVHIRTTAKEIGQLSIRQTAASRQHDEEMRSRQREAEEQSCTGSTAFNEYVYSLDSTEQAEEDVVLDFKLTAVHHAYHIYSCLGIGEKFRDYYHKNRLMQLQLDLQVPTMQPFLESHQAFLAQVAGFFIVECRVLRSAGGLLTEEQVESTWDTAIAKITPILEDQFARPDTASHLLLIKDYVSLFGVTLNRYGYQVGPLMDILDKSWDKYHELLLTECRRQISEILSNDSYEQLKLKKEHEYNTNVLVFNLQDMDMVSDFPYTAPFSSSVPEVCRVIRSFIEDSVSYLSYGGGFIVSSYEVMKKCLDKLLIEVLNNTLLNIIHRGAFSVPQAMQIGANISVFERACDCFFLWLAGQLCGIPKRIVERPHSGLTAKAVLKAAQNVAYNKLLDLVNDRLDSIMGQMSNINWIAEEVPEHANDYMNEVLVYLDSVVSAAQQILPLEALYKVTIGALGHVSDYIMAAFLSDNLKRFTVSAVSSIDIDWKLLESFAEERYHSTGVSEIGKDLTFADCLVEVRQLLNLLLSNQPENFINPVIRAKNYGTLDYKKVAIICEKYKDAPDRLFGSLSNRNTKQSARKKSMDVLKKRLKDMS